jgi:uncharacterized protein with HEPN domain
MVPEPPLPLEPGGLRRDVSTQIHQPLILDEADQPYPLPPRCVDTEPGIPWKQIARMRDHLAHRYFDTSHAILQTTIDRDPPDLEQAIRRLGRYLPDEPVDTDG